mmetsp:Transcript_12633/g.19123  ORF Transcript_12633/g.19123 Transcript_12633/m.19123 type:complete len:95 (+) Transcript_12633:845-1129(+)
MRETEKGREDHVAEKEVIRIESVQTETEAAGARVEQVSDIGTEMEINVHHLKNEKKSAANDDVHVDDHAADRVVKVRQILALIARRIPAIMNRI